MKERITELWEQATGLQLSDSPVEKAVINECVEVGQGTTSPYEAMSDAMDTLAEDCRTFSKLLANEGRSINEKVIEYTLVTDKDITLAAWNSLSVDPSFSFPGELWRLGIMLLEGQPTIVEGGVELIIDGRRNWRYNVPEGAKKRLAALASYRIAYTSHKVD